LHTRLGSLGTAVATAILIVGVAVLLAPSARAASGSARLPGVGHDASYRAVPCPNPLLPGFPLVLGPNFQCGYLTVPENRTRRGARKLQVAVAIAKAASAHPKADPLLWLVGGPGGSGLVVANRVVAQGINADRDVIVVDQRGTLKSNPLLGCPTYDRYVARSYGLAPASSAALSQEVASVAACRRSWVSRGYDVSSFNTPENAADMADLRIALGIKSWNVYGVSYGADLALQLLRDYPEGIRSEVLDSVAPPQANFVSDSWPNAATGYKNVVRACDVKPACHAAYPHLARELVTAVNRLTRRPLTLRPLVPGSGTQTEVVFDGYQFANLLVGLSLSPGSFAQVPALVHEMATGDAAQSAQYVAGSFGTASATVGLAGNGLAFSVFCGENVAFTTPAKALAAARRALPGFPNRVLALMPQIAHIFADCRAWGVKPPSRAVTAPARSKIPVLELSGTFDAATSLAWAKLATRTLPNARIIQFPGLGHGVVTWSQCGADITADFLNRPHGGYSTACAAKLPG